MINLVLAYSQQHANKCKMGDTETDHMYAIAKALNSILLPDKRLNLYLVPPQDTGDDLDNLRSSIRLSNTFIKPYKQKGEPCFHVELHSDAGGYSKGCSALYKSETGKALATSLYNELADLTPTADAGIRYRDNLGALNQTLAVATIIEVSFHDDIAQAKWIHLNSLPIAIRLANGLFKFFISMRLL
jgi:hypothetical protein